MLWILDWIAFYPLHVCWTAHA